MRYINVQNCNLAHAHKPKFGLVFFFSFLLALFDFFLLPFSFPFSLLFYSRYLLLLISFLSPVKSWLFKMGKPWKWVFDQLWVQWAFLSPFLHLKLITFSCICSIGKRSISKTDSWEDRPILALSAAYQEYLVALNWWRHKWYNEHDQLYTHICVVSTLRVK